MRGVNLQPATTIAEQGFQTTTLALFSHALTHMDAPRHFLSDGRTLDQLDLGRCIGDAVVLDLSAKPDNSLIEVEDIAPFADSVRRVRRVLLRTDWDQHVMQPSFRTDFPRISAALARWLVEQGVVLVGVQSPSVASLRPENHAELVEVHEILLRADVVIVEGLANLNLLPTNTPFQFIALPLKLEGGDGTPVRPVAIFNNE
jgi:kynurenine formamidase